MTDTTGSGMMGPKLGEGREAEIYSWGPDAVLKLYRPGFGGHRNEALALQALEGNGVAPRMHEVISHGARTGIVLQRLQGKDMLASLQRRPWQAASVGRVLADTHLAIHEPQAPAGLADQRLLLAERIGDADLPAPLRGFALGLLDRLPDGDRLCHGDFHPGNALVSGTVVRVIDWAAAARGAPEADHARTFLLLRWADPPPGTPALIRGLIAAMRWRLTRAYTRAYRRGSPHRLRQLDSWLTVNLAARLGEGIDAERAKLTALLERAHRNGIR